MNPSLSSPYIFGEVIVQTLAFVTADGFIVLSATILEQAKKEHNQET
jgi:hypothetical protein